ncbi:MAG: TRZ/ATZ family hydrolase [bacterium]
MKNNKISKYDTLIKARWVLPICPENKVLENQLVGIKNGRLELLESDQGQCIEAKETVVLDQHVLMPGMINAHTHLSMNLLRGLADDLPLMTWLNDYIWPAEGQWVGREFVRDGSMAAMAELIRGGCTCFNDMYFFPDETADVAHEIGMRGLVGMTVIDFPTAWANSHDDYFDKCLAVYEHVKDMPLVSTSWAPHAPYTVCDDNMSRLHRYSEQQNNPVNMHIHETQGEVDDAVEKDGLRPLDRLNKLGLINDRLIAVHMTALEDHEINLLAENGSSVVHCPESNMKLASGIAPVEKLRHAGVNVAIGTDGAASNNDLDMIGEMRSAAMLGKIAGTAEDVPAQYVLEMATINGARALGIDSEVGSIEVGKSADLVALDFSGIETTPVYNVISQLVYAASRYQVSDVWVAGKQLLKERELQTIDKAALQTRIEQWGVKIQKTGQ